MYDGYRSILSEYRGEVHPLSPSRENKIGIRNLVISRDNKKMTDDETEFIYCNDSVYLCNENGKTIERL
jgi:hypothetical protein